MTEGPDDVSKQPVMAPDLRELQAAIRVDRLRTREKSESWRAFVIKVGMNRQEILDRLRQNERALREGGVTHAALFGSRARGDYRL